MKLLLVLSPGFSPSRDIHEICVIFDEYTVKVIVRRLKECLKFFNVIKQNFSSITKTIYINCTCFVSDPDVFLQKMDKNSHKVVYLDTEILV